jgi:hypothetical protein
MLKACFLEKESHKRSLFLEKGIFFFVKKEAFFSKKIFFLKKEVFFLKEEVFFSFFSERKPDF